jgi:purine-cytosine permease-like protein
MKKCLEVFATFLAVGFMGAVGALLAIAVMCSPEEVGL